jgi:hypothetical protein
MWDLHRIRATTGEYSMYRKGRKGGGLAASSSHIGNHHRLKSRPIVEWSGAKESMEKSERRMAEEKEKEGHDDDQNAKLLAKKKIPSSGPTWTAIFPQRPSAATIRSNVSFGKRMVQLDRLWSKKATGGVAASFGDGGGEGLRS